MYIRNTILYTLCEIIVRYWLPSKSNQSFAKCKSYTRTFKQIQICSKSDKWAFPHDRLIFHLRFLNFFYSFTFKSLSNKQECLVLYSVIMSCSSVSHTRLASANRCIAGNARHILRFVKPMDINNMSTTSTLSWWQSGCSWLNIALNVPKHCCKWARVFNRIPSGCSQIAATLFDSNGVTHSLCGYEFLIDIRGTEDNGLQCWFECAVSIYR